MDTVARVQYGWWCWGFLGKVQVQKKSVIIHFRVARVAQIPIVIKHEMRPLYQKNDVDIRFFLDRKSFWYWNPTTTRRRPNQQGFHLYNTTVASVAFEHDFLIFFAPTPLRGKGRPHRDQRLAGLC